MLISKETNMKFSEWRTVSPAGWKHLHSCQPSLLLCLPLSLLSCISHQNVSLGLCFFQTLLISKPEQISVDPRKPLQQISLIPCLLNSIVLKSSNTRLYFAISNYFMSGVLVFQDYVTNPFLQQELHRLFLPKTWQSITLGFHKGAFDLYE